jgi:DNA polymerase-3 subunit epsilon/ATP-dependent DNA helicase DinG
MEYVALDLETTGLEASRDRVIEVGAVAFTPAGVSATLERLANPGRAVPEAVLRLTGIDPEDLVGASSPKAVLSELAEFMRGRRPVGHGAKLDVDFLVAAGHWPDGLEVLDTLDVARILLPDAPSHSLPLLASELGLEQPRPHRALDDADATRQLLLRLREEAAALDEELKLSMLALVAPYGWAVASFFADALAEDAPAPPMRPARKSPEQPSERVGKGEPPDDDHAMVALLGPEGPLARGFPGYEHRESQLQMLLAVSQIIRRGGTLVVEAGTGTGKSLAYLIPAAARAVRRGERVVIATHTHTLQEQLVEKDIPALRRWLPWEFRACLLKGRSNYVSLRRWRRYLAEPCRDSAELCFKLKALVWLRRTETGDRSELRLQGTEEAFWARIASDPLDCVGFHCTDADCFVHRARAEAESADLVIVNHALLLADAGTKGNLLPPYEHLVVDEAHHLEDAATDGLRSEVDGAGVVALLNRLASLDESGRRQGLIQDILIRPRFDLAGDALLEAEPSALAASAHVAALFEATAEWARARLPEANGRRDESLRLLPEHREDAGWDRLSGLASDATTALAALQADLGRAVASRSVFGDQEPDQSLREVEVIRGRLEESRRALAEAFAEPDPNRVYWFVLLARTNSVLLRSALLDVGSLLREHVYQDRSSVVLTSASLAVAGNFDYFCSRAGVSRAAETLVVPSPFDYLRQSLICLPTDMPEPDHEDFEPMVEEVVADVARRLEGRTLALFTSHQQLRDVYTALKHRSDLDEVLILGQGMDGQRRQVLQAFEDSDRALLLGTAGLWEGIDIPGDQLSCVVIVRLPFPVPTEPVYAARSERLRDPFVQYALPMAVLRLKQGFGRLIRRQDDRGAVVLLDGRVLARDYGRAFLEGLPPASRLVGPASEVGEQVEDWLATSTGVR